MKKKAIYKRKEKEKFRIDIIITNIYNLKLLFLKIKIMIEVREFLLE